MNLLLNFSFIFGGSVPHYFYQTVERLFHEDVKFRKFFQFISERLIYAPLYQVLSLYFLSRFEVVLPTKFLVLININFLFYLDEFPSSGYGQFGKTLLAFT